MIERRTFSFIVGGIEESMIAALKEYCKEYNPDVSAYGGELDAKNLREALEHLQPRFPLYLASYGDGKDTFQTALGPEIGAPHQYRHDCSFTVICCSNNARSEGARRRGALGDVGVWEMVEDAQTALSRMQFVVVVGEEKFLLNQEPLNPAGVEYIAHLPEMTAYAVQFDTYFFWVTPDRREPASSVQEIEIELFPSTGGTNSDRPGVVLE
ncbi:MAG: DUF1834 family protein [Acidobacteria bacterium]|nr:DUF1834 family protein [Acidobacteriota bacterium]